MKKKNILLISALVGMALLIVSLFVGANIRSQMLTPDAATRAAVIRSIEQFFPNNVLVPPVTGAIAMDKLKTLTKADSIAFVWLVDADGVIRFRSGGPGQEGENIATLATDDLVALIEGLPENSLQPDELMLSRLFYAMRRDGDHNDVFRNIVRPLQDSNGTTIAYLGVTYDINSSIRTPAFEWPLWIVLGLGGFLVYWLSLPLWVYLQARERGEKALFWGLFTLFANLVGVLAFLITRRE